MFAKQRFDTNIYMKLFRWAYILLMGTLCFSLVNLPFFFATISLAIDVRNVLFFALSLSFVVRFFSLSSFFCLSFLKLTSFS